MGRVPAEKGHQEGDKGRDLGLREEARARAKEGVCWKFGERRRLSSLGREFPRTQGRDSPHAGFSVQGRIELFPAFTDLATPGLTQVLLVPAGAPDPSPLKLSLGWHEPGTGAPAMGGHACPKDLALLSLWKNLSRELVKGFALLAS